MIQPINDYVVILPDAVNETSTASGLILPEMVEDKKEMITGEVLAVDEHDKIKKGDKVLFNKYVSVDIILDGVKLVMVDCSKILAIMGDR